MSVVKLILTNENITKGERVCVLVRELDRFCCSQILRQLVKMGQLQNVEQAVLVSQKPKSYLIDILLYEDRQLKNEKEDEEIRINKKAQNLQQAEKKLLHDKKQFSAWSIVLPIELKVLYKNKTTRITSFRQIDNGMFQILQKVGQGTYAEVFLVREKSSLQLFAMKRINKAECRQKGSLQMIGHEMQVLQSGLRQVTRLYFAFEDNRYVYFVTEYCCLGDLASALRSKNNEKNQLTLREKYSVWIQVALAVMGLHARGVIYRDLKPENVILNEKGEAKLCDFGLARPLKAGEKLSEPCGSYEYLAPEVVRAQRYDFSLDLYCLGLLFYEMLVGTNPFEGCRPENINEIKLRKVSFEKKNLLPSVKDLLKKLITDLPQDRIGFTNSTNIFHHQFFTENQDLVQQIVSNKTKPFQTFKYQLPQKIQNRIQLQKNQIYFFSFSSYNYLKPKFNVINSYGPKFKVNF